MSADLYSQHVAVVIPALRFSARLARCLDALSKQTYAPSRIVVVTSHAADAPIDITRRRPDIRFEACPPPASFCRAVNLGIRGTTGEWVLVLNDDAVLTPQFLESLLSGIPADGRIGMVCGKLLSADGRTIDSTGQFLTRARTARERGYQQQDRGQFNAPGYVFSVPAAAALYRRPMLEAIAPNGQYFDERLGMYLEDLELGWRAQRAGWKAYYVPHAVALHARGSTAKTRIPRWPWLRRYYLPWLAASLQARYIANRYAVIRKHDSWRALLIDAPWLLWYELRLWSYVACFQPAVLLCLVRGCK